MSEAEPASLVLTNYRVRQYLGQKTKGEKCRAVKSVMLRHITSCQFEHREQPGLLVAAIALLLVAAIAGSNSSREPVAAQVGIGLAVVGAIFLVGYFQSRRFELSISSPSATLHVAAIKTSYGDICNFVDQVEEAIHLETAKEGYGVLPFYEAVDH